ncbi:MAG: DUF885 domain-containing protein [Deltaproteobacteria bacterium]|nr:DUF885 domain-containing protein [Deltaproteobacteria bacterium]
MLRGTPTLARGFLLGAALFCLAGCLGPQSARPLDRLAYRAADSQRLHELLDSYFEEMLRLNPVFATSIGEHRYDDQLGDGLSEEHRERERLLSSRYLEALSRLERERFPATEQLSYDLFRRHLALNLEELEFQQHLLPVRQLFSTPIEFPLLGSGTGIHPFRTVRDYDNFLKRIEEFETWTDLAIANMRRGVQAGVVQPKVVMERTLPQLEAMLIPDVRQSVFFQPIIRIPSGFSEAERARLATAYARAIERRIIPAYRKLHAFIKEEYLPACRAAVALSDLPGGSAWYSYLVKFHTTTDLEPDEIFEIGLKEVERIKGEIEALKEKTSPRGEPAGSARQGVSSAPGYRTKEELIQAYEELRARVTPQLNRLFGLVPQAPYEIRPIEEFRERSAPSQYWSPSPDGSRPGIFYVNAAGVQERPRQPSEPLFLHEAVPGHHLQISLQRQNPALPRFRRFGRYTAFSEGWALYAEGLGHELGLYTDPDQYLGRLNSELFRAVRLVVDVGLHHKGWTRGQALKFMMQNTGASEAGAALEIDRYIALPGQALAYKIGQLKISQIRARAEKALGANFAIRAFHDELLKDGAMPLDLLEAKMDGWIAGPSDRALRY